MKIEKEKLKADENIRTPVEIPMRYDDCPLNRICFVFAGMYGDVIDKCKYLKLLKDDAECIYDNGGC